MEVDNHALDVLLTPDLLVVNNKLEELGSSVFELDEKDACVDDDSFERILHEVAVILVVVGHVYK